ncbi:MAG: hypothetical protein RJA34_1473, partial [Pseudomonadota bacterium]
MNLQKLISKTAIAIASVLVIVPCAQAGGGGFVGAMESTQWMN